MDTLTRTIRTVLFFIGIGVVIMAGIAAAMNYKADTLFQLQHGSSVLGLGLFGIACLYLATHFHLPAGFTLPAGTTNALAAVEKAAAPLIQRFEDKAKEIATAEAAKAKEFAEKAVRDEAGKFGITIPAGQNIESIYHLAEQAVAVADPALKADMLKLCRELNDKFFALHHSIPTPEVQNDPKVPAKNPAATA